MWNKLFSTKSKKNRLKKSTFSNVIKSLSLSSTKVNCATDADKKTAGIKIDYSKMEKISFQFDGRMSSIRNVIDNSHL